MQRGVVIIAVDKEGKVSLRMSPQQDPAEEAAAKAIQNGQYKQIAVVGQGVVFTAKEQS